MGAGMFGPDWLDLPQTTQLPPLEGIVGIAVPAATQTSIKKQKKLALPRSWGLYSPE